MWILWIDSSQKLRHHASDHSPFPPKGSSGSISLISDSAQTLPKSLAVGCNAWAETTPSSATYVVFTLRYRWIAHCLVSSLSYSIPLNGLVFVQSNVSYQSDPSTLQDISGTLSVGVNADSHAKEGVASVTMHYSNKSLKDQTSVCLMNVSNSSGLYLYVPSNLSSSESLSFNVTFLFPQAPPLYISEFVTLLPHFDQYFASLSEWVNFDKVTLGGPRSQVSVAVSLTPLPPAAMSHVLCSQSMRRRWRYGRPWRRFKATSTSQSRWCWKPSLRTYNASRRYIETDATFRPIDVNVSLHNLGRADPTFLDVSTGNA